MTLPADDHSDNDKRDLDKPNGPGKAEAGKADANSDAGRALAAAAASPVNPFLAAASEQAEAADAAPLPRSLASRMLDYSAHAAIIVGLIGFAWTVGDHVVNRPASVATTGAAASASASKPTPDIKQASEPKPAQKHDELADLRQSNQKMHDEIRALRASIETLRNVVRRDTTPEQVRMLSAGLDGMKSSIGTMRSETGSAIAQLNAKVDKLQPGKLRDLSDRVVRLEHQAVDTTSTASIPHVAAEASHPAKGAPKPPVKPASLAGPAEAPAPAAEDKPQVIAGWAVRDVYRGVALVENKRGGTMEVVPGVTIPGAGVVKSIERHGAGWTVTTSKGQFASDAPAPRPAAHPPYGRGYGYGYGYGYGPGSYRYGY